MGSNLGKKPVLPKDDVDIPNIPGKPTTPKEEMTTEEPKMFSKESSVAIPEQVPELPQEENEQKNEENSQEKIVKDVYKTSGNEGELYQQVKPKQTPTVKPQPNVTPQEPDIFP